MVQSEEIFPFTQVYIQWFNSWGWLLRERCDFTTLSSCSECGPIHLNWSRFKHFIIFGYALLEITSEVHWHVNRIEPQDKTFNSHSLFKPTGPSVCIWLKAVAVLFKVNMSTVFCFCTKIHNELFLATWKCTVDLFLLHFFSTPEGNIWLINVPLLSLASRLLYLSVVWCLAGSFFFYSWKQLLLQKMTQSNERKPKQ